MEKKCKRGQKTDEIQLTGQPKGTERRPNSLLVMLSSCRRRRGRNEEGLLYKI